MTDSMREVLTEILLFRDQRDWGQFHTVKNLAAAIAVEAAELQEAMLWTKEAELPDALNRDTALKENLTQEIADVLIYALLLCHAVGVEPIQAIRTKLELNAQRYPVAVSKGTSVKYNRLPKNRDGET